MNKPKKHTKHKAATPNSLKGQEWLTLKALLCFSCFWQTLNKGEQ